MSHLSQPRSCLDHHLRDPSAPSGNYQIETSNGTVVTVYCDMEGTNCNGQGGWTRIAFVNMSEPGATCPTGLTQITQSNLTLCSRDDTTLIQSTSFTSHGLSYSAVCGRVRGYQLGTPGAFVQFNFDTSLTVNDQYVGGVSITHGTSPRHHVWTYAAGHRDNSVTSFDCPCNNGSSALVPPYVGDNYYCESATDNMAFGQFYSSDPLWDNMQCNNAESTCCPSGSRQPWFNTTLTETTNDDLELRLIHGATNINITGSPLDLIELYIR